MLKRYFIMMVLAGAFLGGYYLGRLPGSPDIFGNIVQTYKLMFGTYKQIMAVKDGQADPNAISKVLQSSGLPGGLDLSGLPGGNTQLTQANKPSPQGAPVVAKRVGSRVYISTADDE